VREPEDLLKELLDDYTGGASGAALSVKLGVWAAAAGFALEHRGRVVVALDESGRVVAFVDRGLLTGPGSSMKGAERW